MDVIISYFEKYYINFSMPSILVTEFVFLVCLIFIFNNRKINKENIFPIICLSILEFFAMWVPLFLMKAYINYYHLNMTYSFISVLVVYGLIKSRKNLIKGGLNILFFATVYVFLTNFGKSINGVIFTNIMGADYSSSDLQLVLSITSIIVMPAAAVIIKLLPLDKYGKISPLYFISSGIVFVIGLVGKILVDSIKGEEMAFYGLAEEQSSLFIFLSGMLIYILATVSYLFAFYTQKRGYVDASLRNEVKQIYKKDKNMDIIEESMNDKLEEMRALKHDISNQISYMQLMMYSKDYAELEQYFDQFSNIANETISFPDCSNKTINNVFKLISLKCKQAGIKLDAKIVVPPQINIKDTDITTLLTNLLDNSIEAIQQDEIKDGVIYVVVQKNDEYLYIEVKNPICNELNIENRKTLKTTKKDKEFHGRGSKIVKSIVNRYDGTISYNITNEIFEVKLALCIGDEVNGNN